MVSLDVVENTIKFCGVVVILGMMIWLFFNDNTPRNP
jgi:hypothetical protein